MRSQSAKKRARVEKWIETHSIQLSDSPVDPDSPYRKK